MDIWINGIFSVKKHNWASFIFQHLFNKTKNNLAATIMAEHRKCPGYASVWPWGE